MKKLFHFFAAALSLLGPSSASLMGAASDSFVLGQHPRELAVNNQILAKVNDKVISVVDVMKKMDMLFYRQFPEYASSVPARFQFYQANWKEVVEDLIDKELIIADAEEGKLAINNGDVRQEMESLFGPSIIASLDKAGLSYDDAWKMILGDITIRRMIYYRVNTKAMRKITPQRVKEAYDEFAKENIKPAEWHYTVISVRDSDAVKGSAAADALYSLLKEGTAIADLPEKANAAQLLGETTVVSVSQPYRHQEKEISASYKESLEALQPGMYSEPVAQKSKADGSTVFRIFFLEELKEGGALPFQEVETEIKDRLLDIAIAEETKVYLDKLRRHFAVQLQADWQKEGEEVFQPFVLR